MKYDAYKNNGYAFCTKIHDGRVYQDSVVCVGELDIHISKEVETTKQIFYYGFLQEVWVLDYHLRQIALFKCDWVNHENVGSNAILLLVTHWLT